MEDKNNQEASNRRESLRNTNLTNNASSESTVSALPEIFNIDSEHSNSSNDAGSNAEGDGSVTKQLRMLTFVNPGKFMDNFDPERSAREMRKMNRRIYRENIKKNQLFDETGVLLDNSQDLCDCLDLSCEGCHFPCPKCGSEKCGHECRVCRKWYYELVEIEGTSQFVKWPFPPPLPNSAP